MRQVRRWFAQRLRQFLRWHPALLYDNGFWQAADAPTTVGGHVNTLFAAGAALRREMERDPRQRKARLVLVVTGDFEGSHVEIAGFTFKGEHLDLRPWDDTGESSAAPSSASE